MPPTSSGKKVVLSLPVPAPSNEIGVEVEVVDVPILDLFVDKMVCYPDDCGVCGWWSGFGGVVKVAPILVVMVKLFLVMVVLSTIAMVLNCW